MCAGITEEVMRSASRPQGRSLSDRQEAILTEIQDADLSTREIADTIGAPEASVRRDMQALRAAGYDIRYEGGYARLYRND